MQLLKIPCGLLLLVLGSSVFGNSAQAQMISPSPLPDVPIPPAHEARPSAGIVPRDRAQYYSSPVTLYPGRASVIDFSQTGEIITYVQLSDLRDIVYNTDSPISSGAARTIVLRPIQPLDIDGTTRAVVPNMVVSTIDSQGNPGVYLFDLYHGSDRPSQSEANGIAITPAIDVQQIRLLNESELRPNTLQTELGAATLSDVERGLSVAIERRYTPADDPIVFAVREAIARARNGTPLRAAAEQLSMEMSVLTALGEIGIQDSMLAPFEAPIAPQQPQEALEQPL